MSLEAWQTALRREFGRAQRFLLKNIGGEPVFSEFSVTNPQTNGTYRVAIRGRNPGDNYCSCPDFAVNTLGTCKHIEFTLAMLERQRGGRAALAAGFQPDYSEVFLRYGAKREVAFRPGRHCPPAIRRLASQYFGPDGLLKPSAYDRFESFLKDARSDGHELRCYEDALACSAQVRDDARRRAGIEALFPQGAGSPAFEKLLKVPLYAYQRQGALFAAKAGRCLLGDEMGLGKTIQAIAVAEILARTCGVERVLVVCPTSLKHQWMQEIEKCADRPAEVVEGPSAARAARYASDTFYKIVNYDVIHRDLDHIRQWAPDLVILDEAQRIKNWRTRTARSVKRLPSQYAIVLTGTPLENRLDELHSILEFVDRFRLGPMFRFLAEHEITDDSGRVVGYRRLTRIAETLRPVLLRRGKAEVLPQLPERLDKIFFVPMTEAQARHHEENREIVARIVAKWRRSGFLTETDQRRLMIALQNMRMACNSTYLLDGATDHGVKADELVTLLAEIFERPDAKVVVFSQWLRMHELIVRRLEARRWPHVLFHGGIPGRQRGDLIRRFKEDSRCRLFLSTDAGGVGLNLQTATVVVNMDQPWNPAVLEQRIGRVHRLGQHRPVRVVSFVAQGTIEQGMLSLLSFKRSLFAGVLDGGEDQVLLGGTRLKRFIESVEKATGTIPTPMPRETAESQAEAATGMKEAGAEDESDGQRKAARVAKAGEPATDLADLLTAGLSFLETLGKALGAGETIAAEWKGRGVSADSFVGRDPTTGQAYLKLPLPGGETLKKIADALGALAQAFRQGS
ncbi:MAG: DEAD/DEAH box helicase [candidate division NC10 bacterium]|nr:DEAD/DEAH box helicase [candidate division NC10 bacterium]